MNCPASWKTLFASLWLGTCLSASATVETRTLSCAVTYAGHTQLISVAPTRSPYDQAAVRIANRFRFKAVHVQGEDVTPRMGIYVYLETERQPLLIQHVLIQPPYPQAPTGSRVDLLGEQRLYAGPLERELIYRCFLDQGTP